MRFIKDDSYLCVFNMTTSSCASVSVSNSSPAAFKVCPPLQISLVLWFLWWPLGSPQEGILHITVVLRSLCMWIWWWFLLVMLRASIVIANVSSWAVKWTWGLMCWTGEAGTQMWGPVPSLLPILFIHYFHRGNFLQTADWPKWYHCSGWRCLRVSEHRADWC